MIEHKPSAKAMELCELYQSPRSYKAAFPHKKAIEIIEGSGGTHFAPYFAEHFINYGEEFVSIAAAPEADSKTGVRA